MRWFFLRTQKWSVIKEKGETMIRLHNLRVETFNPTFVSTHHIRKRVRMKLSWASTRDRVVCQLGESRKKSWRIFERAREREKQCSASIERIHVRKVCSKLRDKRPPSLESIRFFILVKRHEPLLTRFQNFVGHSPPTCPAYFEPSFLRNCTLLPPTPLLRDTRNRANILLISFFSSLLLSCSFARPERSLPTLSIVGIVLRIALTPIRKFSTIYRRRTKRNDAKLRSLIRRDYFSFQKRYTEYICVYSYSYSSLTLTPPLKYTTN